MMEPNPKLKEFIKPYSQEVQDIAMQLRAFVIEAVPEANELIWDNYNAVAIAYAKSEKLSDAFCHIALYSKYVNFGFNRGTELSTHALKLKGQGKLIRHISVTDFLSFPKDQIKPLLLEAVGISEKLNPSLLERKTKPKSIIKSVSVKKTRPNSKQS